MIANPMVSFRKLGRTGFDVSTVGFGLWQIAGGRWKSDSRKRSIQLLRVAQDLGINIFDAAAVYGQYRATSGIRKTRAFELLGAAFAGVRESVYYCIKLGQLDEYSHRGDFSPRNLVGQLQSALRELRTDWIDICLVHAPAIEDMRRGQARLVLETLRECGYVRAIGYAVENDPEHVMLALNQGVDVVMLQYNLLEVECRQAIEAARRCGVGVLVCGPYKRGYLTGRFSDLDDLPIEDDYWKWNLLKNPGKVSRILDQVRALKLSAGSDADLRREALRSVLMEPGVASAIIGHRSRREVRENLMLAIDQARSLAEPEDQAANDWRGGGD